MKKHEIILSILFLLPLIGSLAEAGDVSDLFKDVSGSVAVIYTKHKTSSSTGTKTLSVDVDSLGSGVLISQDGKMMTAAHVVQIADQIMVGFSSGDMIDARVISSAPFADVALLQLDRVPEQVKGAKLGNSENVRVGDEIFVVGAPFGLSRTLTVGHISGRHKPNAVVGGFEQGELFLTDAAINRGNSGGPMFDMTGEVIGIVSRFLSSSGTFEGLGLAVTSQTARRLLLEEPSFWIGIDGHILTGQLAEAFNLPQEMGILVQRVAENSPAARMGLRPGTVKAQIGNHNLVLGGDVILEVAGIPIGKEGDTYEKIQNRLSCMDGTELIKITVLRGGRQLQLGAPVGNLR